MKIIDKGLFLEAIITILDIDWIISGGIPKILPWHKN